MGDTIGAFQFAECDAASLRTLGLGSSRYTDIASEAPVFRSFSALRMDTIFDRTVSITLSLRISRHEFTVSPCHYISTGEEIPGRIISGFLPVNQHPREFKTDQTGK